MIIKRKFYRPFTYFRQLFFQGTFLFVRGVKKQSGFATIDTFNYPVLSGKKDACTACDICTSLCPTDCLQVEGVGMATKFNLKISDCIQCGVCIELCPENALDWDKKADNLQIDDWTSLLP